MVLTPSVFIRHALYLPLIIDTLLHHIPRKKADRHILNAMHPTSKNFRVKANAKYSISIQTGKAEMRSFTETELGKA